MSANVTISLHGPDAEAAFAELRAAGGLAMEPPVAYVPESAEKGVDPLTLTALIVGLVTNAMQIATFLADWARRWKERDGGRMTVVIEDARGRRILLDRATPEEIAGVLRALESAR